MRQNMKPRVRRVLLSARHAVKGCSWSALAWLLVAAVLVIASPPTVSFAKDSAAEAQAKLAEELKKQQAAFC